jgi:SAM-dependent methyltransferase
MHLTYRKTCRVCGSPSLTKVIDLGEQHLQGSFVKPGKELPPMRKIPTRLVRCNPLEDEKACGLLQMECTVPQEILYSAYWYRSGTNQTMRSHLRGIAEDSAAMVGRPDAMVLDIGCNDGTMLNFYPPKYRKIGIDPSDVAREVKGDITVVQDVFPSEQLARHVDGRKFDVVSSIAMFYDLEDPVAFSQSVKSILAPEGLWVFEMSYMPSMLVMNSYDTICHEHIEYYSLAVLEKIMRRANMKIIRAELNAINGGSIRCYAAHAGSAHNGRREDLVRLGELRQKEFDLKLDTDTPYRNFQSRIRRNRTELRTLLETLRKRKKRIHIYGASTKGNTILQWCGIGPPLVEAAADRNPDKYGAHTLGTNIPIISEEESRAMNPDYYLVLPWHFRKEFLEREKEALKRGVKMIFPLPKVEIVGAD